HAYYAADGSGNVTALVNAKQVVLAKYQYDPYGSILSQSGPLAGVNSYRFSSKEADQNSGLIYFGFRYYEPSLQRWVNRDPIQEGGGLNLYQVTENNPIGKVDFFGMIPIRVYTYTEGGISYEFWYTEVTSQYNPWDGWAATPIGHTTAGSGGTRSRSDGG